MKPFIFMAAMVLSLSACDNTKLQLRAPGPAKANDLASTQKADTLKADTIRLDTAQAVAVKH